MRISRLAPLGRLDRYVGSLFLLSYATAILLVVGLVLILDLASNLSWFETWEDGSEVPNSIVARYYILNLPFLYLQVAPFITAVAALFTVSRLIKNNELVAGLAAGVSAHRVLLPVFLGAVMAALAMVGIRELATPDLYQKRAAVLDVLENQRFDPVIERLWIKSEDRALVRLEEFRPGDARGDSAVVRGLQCSRFEGGTRVEVTAAAARWNPKADPPVWILEGGTRLVAGETPTQDAIERLPGRYFTPTDALLAHKSQERPLELTLKEVLHLGSGDPDNVQYQTLLQYLFTFPLANVILVLVSIPFLVGRERGRGAEGLTAACLLALFYFGSDFVARSLGFEGALTPMMASWLPILTFGSLGVVLYDGMRS